MLCVHNCAYHKNLSHATVSGRALLPSVATKTPPPTLGPHAQPAFCRVTLSLRVFAVCDMLHLFDVFDVFAFCAL